MEPRLYSRVWRKTGPSLHSPRGDNYRFD